jgi:hypothetical protein
MRALMGTTRMHKGIDFEGSWLVGPVFAAADGTVSISQTSDSYGEWIEIRHDRGYSTRYAHMTWRHVSAGDDVKQGDVIGRFGSTGRSTGTHLHFEILRNGAQVDPMPLLPRIGVVGDAGRARAAPVDPDAGAASPKSETKPAPAKKPAASGATKPKPKSADKPAKPSSKAAPKSPSKPPAAAPSKAPSKQGSPATESGASASPPPRSPAAAPPAVPPSDEAQEPVD